MTNTILSNFLSQNVGKVNSEKFVYLQLILSSIIGSIGFIDNNVLILLIAILLSPIGNIILEIPTKIFLNKKNNKPKYFFNIFLKLIGSILLIIVTSCLVEIISHKNNELKQIDPDSYLEKTIQTPLYYTIPISICLGLIYSISQTTGIVAMGITLILQPIISFGINLGKIIRYNIWKSHYDELDSNKTEDEPKNSELYELLLDSIYKPFKQFVINLLSVLTCLLVVSHISINHFKNNPEIDIDGNIGDSVKNTTNKKIHKNIDQGIMDNLVMQDIAKSIADDMSSDSFCNQNESIFSD